jgi:hypothetical protein
MFLRNTQNNEKALLQGSHYGAWDLLTPPRHSGRVPGLKPSGTSFGPESRPLELRHPASLDSRTLSADWSPVKSCPHRLQAGKRSGVRPGKTVARQTPLAPLGISSREPSPGISPHVADSDCAGSREPTWCTRLSRRLRSSPSFHSLRLSLLVQFTEEVCETLSLCFRKAIFLTFCSPFHKGG